MKVLKITTIIAMILCVSAAWFGIVGYSTNWTFGAIVWFFVSALFTLVLLNELDNLHSEFENLATELPKRTLRMVAIAGVFAVVLIVGEVTEITLGKFWSLVIVLSSIHLILGFIHGYVQQAIRSLKRLAMKKLKIPMVIVLILCAGGTWFGIVGFSMNWNIGAVAGILVWFLNFLVLSDELKNLDPEMEYSMAKWLKVTPLFVVLAVAFYFLNVGEIGPDLGQSWSLLLVLSCILLISGFVHGHVQQAVRSLKRLAMKKLKVPMVIALILCAGGAWFGIVGFSMNWNIGAVAGILVWFLNFLVLSNELKNLDPEMEYSIAKWLKVTLLFVILAVVFSFILIVVDKIGVDLAQSWSLVLILSCVLLISGFVHGHVQQAVRSLKRLAMKKLKIPMVIALILCSGAAWFGIVGYSMNWNIGAVAGILVWFLNFLILSNELKNLDPEMEYSMDKWLRVELLFVVFAVAFYFLDVGKIEPDLGQSWSLVLVLSCILLISGFVHGQVQQAARLLYATIKSA